MKEIKTRRGILSLVSSMYDPMGFASPFVLPAKQVLQRLCQAKYGWDEVLPENEIELWRSWQGSIIQLKTVTIPRCIKRDLSANLRSVEVHNFGDASRDGYGAASYLRQVDEEGKVIVSLLVAKSRVTPLKPVTIPRLELTAAVLAVKLNRQVEEELEIPINRVVFWTDSTVVLQYINNESRRFQTFVANRLAVIHDMSKPSMWRHVDTRSNPADYASRGLRADEQRKIHVWLNGPNFLREDEDKWPEKPEGLKELPDEQLEWRKTVQVHEIATSRHETAFDRFLKHYSSWYALQKGVAWFLRFLSFLCSGKKSSDEVKYDVAKGHLTVEEVCIATDRIVRYVQRQCFPEEIETLETTGTENIQARNLLKRSNLRKLSPVLVNGILRVGGRLERSSLSFDVKHPIILPQKHPITKLIIRHYHRLEGHMGSRQVLASIRKSFWIIHGPSEVRKLIKTCMECQRRYARPGDQVMANLPDARVTPSNPPFTFVGVDYFGPIMVRQGRGQVKRYGCLFTCLTMRAVHIEIAHSLDAESFLCAFSRFTNRRGQPTDVYSDNGTNFTATHSTLKEEFKKLQSKTSQTRIQDRLRRSYIQWHFNPPAASHMGGIWERIIRSIRRILKALLKEQIVNDEALLTFMTEVERILNDRPIVRQENHLDDLDPLTPNKLLLLRADEPLSLGVVVNGDKYNRRWRQAQELANAFWKRWIKEYLPLLQERQKWTAKKRNLQVDDLVLVMDEKKPRGQWPLGLVEESYPDKYGVVRQVLVRTSNAKVKRDTRKLCLLEGVY